MYILVICVAPSFRLRTGRIYTYIHTYAKCQSILYLLFSPGIHTYVSPQAKFNEPPKDLRPSTQGSFGKGAYPILQSALFIFATRITQVASFMLKCGLEYNSALCGTKLLRKTVAPKEDIE